MKYLLLVAASLLVWNSFVEGVKDNITIAVLYPYKAADHETGYKTAVEMACNIARNRSDFQELFKNYNIDFQFRDTFKTALVALLRVYQFYLLKDTKKPFMFLGPAYSETAVQIASTAKLYKFFQVSFAATSNKLLENDNIMNTGPSMPSFNNATIALMSRFKWERAAILYDFRNRDGYFTEKTDKLVESFKIVDMNLIGIEAIDVSPYTTKDDPAIALAEKLEKLKADDTKIFIGEFGLEAACLLFCEVYHQKLFGRGFVWILHYDVREFNEWKKSCEKAAKSVNCTEDQLLLVLNYAFVINKMDVRRDVKKVTASGLSVNEYFDILNKTLAAEYKAKYKGLKWNVSTLAFDAMWMTAIALNNTIRRTRQLNMSSIVTSVSSQKIKVINELRKSLQEVNFQGLSGPVSFNKDREREGVLLIEQFRDGSRTSIPVGQYFMKSGQLDFFNQSDQSLFGGKIPLDHSENETITLRTSSASYVAFSATASVGIVIGVVFLVFNRYYRSYKFIRLSAPIFNDVIVLGCILCLSTVFVFGIRVVDEPENVFPILCKARAWTLTIGFSLAFGAMFIKTWRIYKICTNKHLKVRIGPLSNWYLLAMVVAIVVIDLVILVTWELLDPLELQEITFEKTSPDRPNVVIIEILNTCSAEYFTVWLTIIYVYKGILLLYGVFLAYETRNVVYAHLNDSRVIGICVYNVVVLSAIGAFLDMVLDHANFRELYAAVSVCIIFPSTATICLLFIPKLVYRLKTDDLNADEMMDTTIARPSIDLTSTCYQATEPKRSGNAPTAAVNSACSQEHEYEYMSPPQNPPQTKVD